MLIFMSFIFKIQEIFLFFQGVQKVKKKKKILFGSFAAKKAIKEFTPKNSLKLKSSWFVPVFSSDVSLRWGSVSWSGRSWTRQTCWSCWASGRSRRSRRTRSSWRGRGASRRTRACRRACGTGTRSEEGRRPRRRSRLGTNSRRRRDGRQTNASHPSSKNTTRRRRAWEVVMNYFSSLTLMIESFTNLKLICSLPSVCF